MSKEKLLINNIERNKTEVMSNKQIEEMAQTMCNGCHCHDKCVIDGICDAVLENANTLYNAGYRKQSEWISVDERLPRENEVVLVYNGEILQRIYTSYNNEVRWWSDECWSSTKQLGITHWMPLPEAPKMKGGAE